MNVAPFQSSVPPFVVFAGAEYRTPLPIAAGITPVPLPEESGLASSVCRDLLASGRSFIEAAPASTPAEAVAHIECFDASVQRAVDKWGVDTPPPERLAAAWIYAVMTNFWEHGLEDRTRAEELASSLISSHDVDVLRVVADWETAAMTLHDGYDLSRVSALRRTGVWLPVHEVMLLVADAHRATFDEDHDHAWQLVHEARALVGACFGADEAGPAELRGVACNELDLLERFLATVAPRPDMPSDSGAAGCLAGCMEPDRSRCQVDDLRIKMLVEREGTSWRLARPAPCFGRVVADCVGHCQVGGNADEVLIVYELTPATWSDWTLMDPMYEEADPVPH